MSVHSKTILFVSMDTGDINSDLSKSPPGCPSVKGFATLQLKINSWAGLFEAGLGYPRVSARFDLRYESLKIKFSFVIFAYNLMIGYSKKNRENYSRECFS